MRVGRLTVLGALLGLVACDCVREVSAVVVDEASGLPVAGATVKDARGFHPGSTTTTDVNGRFTYSDISGGFRCPPVRLSITTADHRATTVAFKRGQEADTVRLAGLH